MFYLLIHPVSCFTILYPGLPQTRLHLQRLLAHLVTFPFLLARHDALVVRLWTQFFAIPAEADVTAGVALIAILWIARTALVGAIAVAILAW